MPASPRRVYAMSFVYLVMTVLGCAATIRTAQWYPMDVNDVVRTLALTVIAAWVSGALFAHQWTLRDKHDKEDSG